MMILSSLDERFFGTLKEWLAVQPEILVLIRYPRAAGSRSFEFFNSFEKLSARIREQSSGTSVIAFRKKQLPFRGLVDHEFIQQCLSKIPESAEFLVVETTPTVVGSASWFGDTSGESHAELREALEERLGESVAVGDYPPFWLEDGPDLISAIVPNEEGLVVPQPY
ncbi:MAG TPA: hypothetical protein VKZ53_10925 [Candidatus Angelobacter sp.]|nr:hypothetical protein [Candidatus Angelobacter sp.]